METEDLFPKAAVMSQCLLKKEFEARVITNGADVFRVPGGEEDEE